MPALRRPAAIVIAALLAFPLPALACSAPGGLSALQAEVIQLVNAERSKAGLTALKASGKLTKIAQSQACDNAATGSVSHNAADGADFGQRLKRGGYRFRAAAENVQRGAGDAGAVVAWWMKSSEHRSNILNRQTREAGVGVGIGGGRNHWALVMGASK